MSESVQEFGQVLGATTAIAGSTAALLDTDNIILSILLGLIIASAAGVLASSIAKRAFIRK